MQIYFLGTGTSQGIPVIGSNHPVNFSLDKKDKRLRTSAWIQVNDLDLIIDIGPDFRQQMLQSKCPKIDALFLTHEHSDHTAGLDDIRPFNYHQNQEIPLYAQERVTENIKERFAYIFAENKYPGAPEINLKSINNFEKFDIQGVKIQSLPIIHGDLPIFGYKINDLAYITDASFISEETIEIIKNCKILVINCLRLNPTHFSHLVLDEVLAYIKKINPEKAYLTHISCQLGFHEEVQKILPKNIFLAYDNLVINW